MSSRVATAAVAAARVDSAAPPPVQHLRGPPPLPCASLHSETVYDRSSHLLDLRLCLAQWRTAATSRWSTALLLQRAVAARRPPSVLGGCRVALWTVCRPPPTVAPLMRVCRGPLRRAAASRGWRSARRCPPTRRTAHVTCGSGKAAAPTLPAAAARTLVCRVALWFGSSLILAAACVQAGCISVPRGRR